ncbi:MAG: Trk family potassium uptake protein [Peptococcaceae bacterium]|nr:Trk family potassium uptake protein [Peptococcaceae bacterium]
MRGLRKKRVSTVSPPRILVVGFAVLIAVGTILLSLPVATSSGDGAGILTALFTSTSAVCVTGLVVVDTGTFWSPFGQFIILLLIQIGGLGFMTMATLFAILLGKKIGLRERMVITEALNQVNPAGIVRLVRNVLIFAFTIEALAALILTGFWFQELGWRSLWFGVFHAVSAFNNAGFDLVGDFRSLSPYVNSPVVNAAIFIPVVLGGLGFAVVTDVYQKRRWSRFALHTRLVLVITLMLLLAGAAIILMLEYNHVLKQLDWGSKIMAALFQAAMPRTAGFSTINMSELEITTQFIITLLMFVGAAPGSTGGGIKITTLAVLVLAAYALSRGREDAEIFRRRIPKDQIYRALTIALIGIVLVILVTLALLISEGQDFLVTLFEAVSAFSVVGLSLGLTTQLSPVGQVLIIITMFIGRLGPLTVAFALGKTKKRTGIRHPEEKILVG